MGDRGFAANEIEIAFARMHDESPVWWWISGACVVAMLAMCAGVLAWLIVVVV